MMLHLAVFLLRSWGDSPGLAAIKLEIEGLCQDIWSAVNSKSGEMSARKKHESCRVVESYEHKERRSGQAPLQELI